MGKCLNCGKELTGRTDRARFCDAKCRVYYGRTLRKIHAAELAAEKAAANEARQRAAERLMNDFAKLDGVEPELRKFIDKHGDALVSMANDIHPLLVAVAQAAYKYAKRK